MPKLSLDKLHIASSEAWHNVKTLNSLTQVSDKNDKGL